MGSIAGDACWTSSLSCDQEITQQLAVPSTIGCQGQGNCGGSHTCAHGHKQGVRAGLEVRRNQGLGLSVYRCGLIWRRGGR
jgi:hypothetical protein